MLLSEIWIYPVKSLAGIAVHEAVAQTRGLEHDRRWMLVDETGRFMSQREIPAMALLGTAIAGDFLRVFERKDPSHGIEVPLVADASAAGIEVEVWGDACAGYVVAEAANAWFSGVLGQAVRFVRMTDDTRRWADARYAPEGQHVSFADGFPYLLVGQSSLDDLNARLDLPLPMNRFRPNLVFTGGAAFEEDEWADFRIGEADFRGVKPCARCVVTTTDQDTAERAAEPLKTLATYRKKDNRILFGQNVIWTGAGEQRVRVGDVVQR